MSEFESMCTMDKMWSAALCTLGVAKPILGCTCLNGRPHPQAAITAGPGGGGGTVRAFILFDYYCLTQFPATFLHSLYLPPLKSNNSDRQKLEIKSEM